MYLLPSAFALPLTLLILLSVKDLIPAGLEEVPELTQAVAAALLTRMNLLAGLPEPPAFVEVSETVFIPLVA